MKREGLRMRAIGFLALASGILVWALGNNPVFAQGNLPPVRTLGFGRVTSVVFSPDGRYLAVGTDGGSSVQLIDTNSWQVIRTFEGHTWGVNSVAFSPDGRLLASGSFDGTIRLWDVATGSEVRTLKGHTSNVNSVAFSPDGRLLASGSDDGTIKLWEVATGSLVRTLEGHTDNVCSVAFSPDGKLLASGSADKTIKLWDVATGSLVRTLKGHTSLSLPWRSAPTGSSSPPAPMTGRSSSGMWPQERSAHPRRPHRRGLVRGVQSRREAPRLRLR